MKYNIEQKVFLVEKLIKSDGRYTKDVKTSFRNKFNCEPMDRKSVAALLKRFRKTGTVTRKSREQEPTLLKREKLQEIKEAMERSPNKSVRRLSQEMDLSVGSAHGALKSLKLFPYKVINPLITNLLNFLFLSF